jgi:hypothetical protein
MCGASVGNGIMDLIFLPVPGKGSVGILKPIVR